jgi:hypothetical protein
MVIKGYDELRLRMDPREGKSYHVHASTPWAEASASFEVPFNELEVENFILKVSRPRGRRRIHSSALDEARTFGGRLFKALFHDEIYGLYRNTLSQARGESRGLRITLCLTGAPELIDVPWEYLFDDPDFLAVSAFTPVVRYLDLPRAHRPLLVEPPLRVLGIVSSPSDYERLDVDRERANLERAVGGLRDAGAVELEWLERPTLGSLLEALQGETFHALHYIGHGAYDRDTERGVLLFEDDAGWARPVSGDKLGMILHDFSSLRLAVLNACEGARTARSDPFAGVAGSLVQSDIPAVVAMQFEISDEAAIAFASGFYRPLAAGSPVDASLAAARLAMLAERSEDIEWGTPVLFMRVPDGRIFNLDEQRLASAPKPQPVPANGLAEPADDRSRPGLNILINYRPEDTAGHAFLLRDRLSKRFGGERVQLSGTERPRVSQNDATAVVLTLIGPEWTSSLKSARAARRADDAPRRQVEWALRDLPASVIPVLIDADMPEAESLPRSLRGLCRIERTELRHASFDRDVEALVTRVQRIADASQRGSMRTAAAAPAPQVGKPVDRPSRAPVSGVPAPYRDHYVDVINGMFDGTVVPLLGTGVQRSLSLADHVTVPLPDQCEITSCGLAEAAQRVAVTLGERRLYTAMKDLVSELSEPVHVHRFLAEFPGIARQLGIQPRYQLIISANYDSALERAFEEANEPFDYAVYLSDSGWFLHVPWGEDASEPTATAIVEPRKYVGFPIDDDGRLTRTIIVKIHGGADGEEGGISWRNNYVVTEDHYIDYLPTDNIQDHLPIQLLDKLTGSRCLFLGYALSDWIFRVFVRRIWKGGPMSENSWAITEDPDLFEKASWSMIGHVELLTDDLRDYVTALRATILEWREAR